GVGQALARPSMTDSSGVATVLQTRILVSVVIAVVVPGLWLLGPQVPAPSQDKAPPARPAWIWLGKPRDDQTVYFRKAFSVNQRITKATLQGTCDNHMVIYINGKEAASSDTWEVPISRDVTQYLKSPAKNQADALHVIAVKAHNREGPAGLLLRLTVELADKKKVVIVTDGHWAASEREQKGWTGILFEEKDSEWARASVVGKLGDAPWTQVNEASLSGVGKFANPTATPIELIKAKKDFKVELLYSVPKAKQGSWVCMCVDPKGRLITSDQYGKLYRVT